mmetsp:Transcript_7854/g.26083  ORF Transcript_7854/g.26083 Transcript_7854/m.26083 type:complete len:205 (-) Transcript_7854:63-677(-)
MPARRRRLRVPAASGSPHWGSLSPTTTPRGDAAVHADGVLAGGRGGWRLDAARAEGGGGRLPRVVLLPQAPDRPSLRLQRLPQHLLRKDFDVRDVRRGVRRARSDLHRPRPRRRRHGLMRRRRPTPIPALAHARPFSEAVATKLRHRLTHVTSASYPSSRLFHALRSQGFSRRSSRTTRKRRRKNDVMTMHLSAGIAPRIYIPF